MLKLFRQEKGRKKFLNKSLWKFANHRVNFQGKKRKEALVSIRIKIGKGDPAVEAWLAAQKSRSGSVQLLIKAFAYLHGNVDITKLGFDELLGVKAVNVEKQESREPEQAEAKGGEKRQEVQEKRPDRPEREIDEEKEDAGEKVQVDRLLSSMM